jgi:SAM-dependent methyltransferase
VDVTVPNASRIYDYALGGVHNFKVDRDFWEQAEKAFPDARVVARANRAFLGRAVLWLAEQGVRQFLDIGSGIPTLGNVHEVAQTVDPEARVVYADIDPVAVEQSRALLKDHRHAIAVKGDLREPEGIVFSEQVTDFLDFSQPVAVLMVAVLHFITDEDDPQSIIHRIGSALMPGSFLVLSHAGPDETAEGRERLERARKLYEQTPTPVKIRTADEVAGLLGDTFTLLDPGVVPAHEWHPDPDEADDPRSPVALVAVARRR